MSSLDEFAEGIRDELVEMPVPPADERLLARVLQSRRDGARMILPTENPRRTRRVLPYASAVAAAAVVVALLTRLLANREGLAPVATDSWFSGAVAYAQSARFESPGFAPAVATRASRLRAMSLHYERHLLTPAGQRTPLSETRIDVARDTIRDAPVWRAVSTTRVAAGRVLMLDSVWMSTDDLRPIRRVVADAPYSRYERIVVEQRFNGNHVAGDMHAWQHGAVTAHRTFDRLLPDSSAPYVADPFATLYLMAVPVTSEWEGSVSLLGWLVRDNDLSIDLSMRVVGQETVRVPAGRFACWRLMATIGSRRVWYWVRQSDGVGLRMLDSTEAGTHGVREMRLIR